MPSARVVAAGVLLALPAGRPYAQRGARRKPGGTPHPAVFAARYRPNFAGGRSYLDRTRRGRPRQRKQGAASQNLYNWAPVADWLSWARDFLTPTLLRALALQLGLIAVVFAVSWLLRG